METKYGTKYLNDESCENLVNLLRKNYITTIVDNTKIGIRRVLNRLALATAHDSLKYVMANNNRDRAVAVMENESGSKKAQELLESCCTSMSELERTMRGWYDK